MIKINNINIHIFYIESETSNGVKTLHTIFNNIEGYIKDNCEISNAVPVDENKGAIEKYKKIWKKIKYLNEPENNSSGDYDDK